jgi:hypothetical protein
MKTIEIPVPNNPHHVNNLASVALLEAQGWEGSDRSLAISLGEYGLAWRDLGNGEFLFIYSHPSIRGRFDRSSIGPVDPFKEWDWVDFEQVLKSIGMEREEWAALPLPVQVADLVNHFGVENIFGSSYWEGFEIAGIA